MGHSEQAESPTLENHQGWGTRNSTQRMGYPHDVLAPNSEQEPGRLRNWKIEIDSKAGPPAEKILNVSISLLLVRLIVRVEVKAVGRPKSVRMRAVVCLLRDQVAWRQFQELMSVLFHTDGREIAGPGMRHQELCGYR
jgi:hypothetical protein